MTTEQIQSLKAQLERSQQDLRDAMDLMREWRSKAQELQNEIDKLKDGYD